MPIEIDQELKDLGELKSDFRNTTPKYLLAFVNTLGNINNLVILRRLTPLLISEKGAALKKQAIDFNILQSLMWRIIQIKIAII